jgi:hypothetical protein
MRLTSWTRQRVVTLWLLWILLVVAPAAFFLFRPNGQVGWTSTSSTSTPGGQYVPVGYTELTWEAKLSPGILLFLILPPAAMTLMWCRAQGRAEYDGEQ